MIQGDFLLWPVGVINSILYKHKLFFFFFLRSYEHKLVNPYFWCLLTLWSHQLGAAEQALHSLVPFIKHLKYDGNH